MTAKVEVNHQSPENNQKVGSNSAGYKDLDYMDIDSRA